MIVRFISSETGEIVMMAKTAHTLFEIIGKETSARGVFTIAEMPLAIAKLKAAIEAEKEAAKEAEAKDDEEDDDTESDKKTEREFISLARRAFPLIEMLKRTAAAGDEGHVMWEAKSSF